MKRKVAAVDALPQVTPDRVIRHVAGLRPFRPSGFVVRSEQFQEKWVVHNYGHGGCGVTLCWGTSYLAVQEAALRQPEAVAVIGCGAVGLASARLLQERGIPVTIYAQSVPPNTTSNVAAAVWFPVTLTEADRFDGPQLPRRFLEQFEPACRISFERFKSQLGSRYGVSWLPLYWLSNGAQPEDGMLSRLPAGVRSLFPPVERVADAGRKFGFAEARRLLTFMIDPSIYLMALRRDFETDGGRIVVREFGERGDLLDLPERVLINCTGLGARQLFDDRELVPVKGQLTVLQPQQEIEFGYKVVDPGVDLYMFPRKEGILLGGSHDRGDWTLTPDPAQAERILRGHQQIVAGAG